MKRLFSLSPRLRMMAELTPAHTRFVDVGTDHGRLPVWLVLNGVVERATASDLHAGPLSRGRTLSRRWGVERQISFRLCDGLSGIAPEEAETVTIAGMGGETIAGILAAAPWAREEGHRYILQAMSGVDGLRRWLNGHSFHISREVLVEEGTTLYAILLAEPGEELPYTEGEIRVGRQRRGMQSPLRGRYLSEEESKLRRAVESMARSIRPGEREKLAQYRQTLADVSAMKEEWEQWQR